MKIYETGKLHVSTALSQLLTEELPDDVVRVHDKNSAMRKAQIQKESDQCWDQYFFREKFIEVRNQLVTETTDAQAIEIYFNTYAEENSFDDIISYKQPTKNRAIRRKQAANNKSRLHKTTIYAGHNPRIINDMHYRTIANRRVITHPTASQSHRFEKLFKRAEKMNLLTLDEVFAS